jgi:outer membrane protein TolC
MKPRCRTTLVIALLLVAAAGARGAPAEGQDTLPVSLADCVRMALESNLDIRVGAIAPGIERERVREAAGEFDQLLTFRSRGGKAKAPASTDFETSEVISTRRFSLDVATTRKIVTGASATLGFTTDRTSTNSFFSLRGPSWSSALYFTVTQPLLRGAWSGYNRSRIELARRQRDKARDDLDVTVQAVIARVEAAYWDLVFAASDLEVKRTSLRVAEEFLETTRRRIAAQKATRVQETQALAGVETRRLDLIAAENALGNAEDALRSLIAPTVDGRDAAGGARPVPTDAVGTGTETVLAADDAIAAALDRHPALRAAARGLEARDIAIRQAKSETLPKLDVFGTAYVRGLDDDLSSSVDPLYDGEFFEWEVGLSLEVPIGNRVARSRLARARLERLREGARVDRLRNDVVVAVRMSVRAVRSARQSIAAAERAARLAAEQLENEQLRLAAGVSTPFEVLQMEEDLSGARSREIRARTLYRIALAEYHRSVGDLAVRHAVDLRGLEIRR